MKNLEVVAAVIARNGKFLCARRAAGGETGGLWEFPGGKIEPGENHRQALQREILEELVIRIDVREFLLTVTHQYRDFFLTMHVYTAGIAEGEPCAREHQALAWLDVARLSELEWAPADLPVVACLQQAAQSGSSR